MISFTFSITSSKIQYRFSFSPFEKWWKREHFWYETFKENGFATSLGCGPFVFMKCQ